MSNPATRWIKPRARPGRAHSADVVLEADLDRVEGVPDKQVPDAAAPPGEEALRALLDAVGHFGILGREEVLFITIHETEIKVKSKAKVKGNFQKHTVERKVEIKSRVEPLEPVEGDGVDFALGLRRLGGCGIVRRLIYRCRSRS